MPATWRASANGGGTAGTTDRSVTIAAVAGDTLVIVGSFSAVISAEPTASDNGTGDNAGATWERIGVAGWTVGTVNGLAAFVRDPPVVDDETLTITVQAVNSAGEIHAHAFQGVGVGGLAAIRSFGFQAEQAGGTTPAPVLSQAALTTNPTLAAVASSDTTTTPPGAWTERLDTSQITPTTALETCTRDSGFTGTTITFGATQTGVYASFACEINGPTEMFPAAERLRFQEGSPTLVLGGVSLSPSSERLRIQEGVASLLLALTLAPASERMRFNEAAPSLVLGALTASPASERLRFREGAPTITAALTFTPVSERLRFQEGSPALVIGPVVLTPPSERIRFRTGVPQGAVIELGRLEVIVGDSNAFQVFVSSTPTFGVVLDVD